MFILILGHYAYTLYTGNTNQRSLYHKASVSYGAVLLHIGIHGKNIFAVKKGVFKSYK